MLINSRRQCFLDLSANPIPFESIALPYLVSHRFDKPMAVLAQPSLFSFSTHFGMSVGKPCVSEGGGAILASR